MKLIILVFLAKLPVYEEIKCIFFRWIKLQASRKASSNAQDENRPRFSLVNFHWQSRLLNSSNEECQNSVQGRDIIVDDKGLVQPHFLNHQ